MARRRNKFPKRPSALNPSLQDLHVRRFFPGFKFKWERGVAVWKGTLQPQELSPVYHVVIQYNHNKVPKVKVISPKLHPKAPELYGDGALCLYWPKEWRWSPDELVAKTIIPWTAGWLYYYELWLDTGQWLGPSSRDAIKIPENERHAD
jgi:hypothetical protein